MAEDVSALWREQRYGECLQQLKQQQRTQCTPKVLHNLAVVEYYADNCQDPAAALRALTAIKEGAAAPSGTSHASSSPSPRKAAQAAAQPADASLGAYDGALLALNTAIILVRQRQLTAAVALLEPLCRSVGALDEDASLQAHVLLLDCHLACGAWHKAAEVLEFVEGAYIMVGAATGTAQGSWTDTSAMSLEAHPIGLPGQASIEGQPDSNGDAAARSPSPAPVPAPLPPGGTAEPERPGSSGLPEGLAAEEGPPRRRVIAPRVASFAALDVRQLVLLYKARLLAACGALAPAQRQLDLLRATTPASAQGDSLAAELELELGSHSQAAQLLTQPPPAARPADADPPEAAADSGAAAAAAAVPPPAHSRGELLCNMGCIQADEGRPHMAALCFAKALQALSAPPGGQPPGPDRSSQAPPDSGSTAAAAAPGSPEEEQLAHLHYNSGLQALLLQRHDIALDSLQRAVLALQGRPLAWLRLAQAALGLWQDQEQQQQRREQQQQQQQQNGHRLPPVCSPLVAAVLGDQQWRRLVLPCSELAGGKAQRRDPAASEDSSQQQAHTGLLELCSQCLANASYVLDASERELAARVEAQQAAAQAADAQHGAASSSADSKANGVVHVVSRAAQHAAASGDREAGLLREAAAAGYGRHARWLSLVRVGMLAHTAYVALLRGSPLAALAAARALLAVQAAPQPFPFLGHCYAAEALCLLGRPAEAAEHLSNAVIAEHWAAERAGKASGSGDQQEALQALLAVPQGAAARAQLASLTGAAARATLYTNLCAVYITQGEVAQAEQLAHQALQLAPGCPRAVLALVYCRLVAGDMQAALYVLRYQQAPPDST